MHITMMTLLQQVQLFGEITDQRTKLVATALFCFVTHAKGSRTRVLGPLKACDMVSVKSMKSGFPSRPAICEDSAGCEREASWTESCQRRFTLKFQKHSRERSRETKKIYS